MSLSRIRYFTDEQKAQMWNSIQQALESELTAIRETAKRSQVTGYAQAYFRNRTGSGYSIKTTAQDVLSAREKIAQVFGEPFAVRWTAIARRYVEDALREKSPKTHGRG